jgi:hypothetical protein
MNFDFQIRRARKVAHDEHSEQNLTRCHFKGNSSTQSNPSTTNSVTDNRVAASEGSVSAGSGATVNIQNTDADAISRIAESSNDALQEVANTAVIAGIQQTNISAGVAKTAIEENADVSKLALNTSVDQSRAALDFGTDVTKQAIGGIVTGQRDALDFGSDALELVLSEQRGAREDTNALIRSTNEQFIGKLAANAGEAPTTLADNTVKYITIASGIIGLALLFKSSKNN